MLGGSSLTSANLRAKLISYIDNTHAMYRKKLLPIPDKKKSRGRKATYCQRLARHLERFDENPDLWTGKKTTPPPPLLRLPPELRQNILFHVLDEDEIRIPRPNSTTRDLALVCKQFAADLPPVMRMWDARAAELSKLCGFERTVMSALIKDMMGPLEIASAALGSQKRLMSSRAKRKAPSRRSMRVGGAGRSSRRLQKRERGEQAAVLRSLKSMHS